MAQATRTRVRRASTLIIVLVLAPACTRWAAPREPLPEAFARDSAQTIRVRERSGKQYYVHSPRLRHDTLFGTQGEDVKVKIPMSDVASVQVLRRDKARSLGLVVGIVGLATLIGFGLSEIFDDSYARAR